MACCSRNGTILGWMPRRGPRLATALPYSAAKLRVSTRLKFVLQEALFRSDERAAVLASVMKQHMEGSGTSTASGRELCWNPFPHTDAVAGSQCHEAQTWSCHAHWPGYRRPQRGRLFLGGLRSDDNVLTSGKRKNPGVHNGQGH